MRKYFLLLCLILVFITNKYIYSQQSFYALDTIQKIEIFFSQSDWNSQLDTLKATTQGFLMADSVRINGTTLSKVGVKYKGTSSYEPYYTKNPLHIKIDKYVSQLYQDNTDIKLSNEYQDPSMIREVLAYKILHNYMFCPRANFAQVYINSNPIGLYSNIEDISNNFCARSFFSLKSNTLVKCNPPSTPGPSVKSDLKYISADSSAYFSFYEIKSDYGWKDLVELCKIVTDSQSFVSSHIDMDRVLWMLAFNNLLINLDSYSGLFAQNYYLFKDNEGIFNPIVWDLNMSFGGFPFAGSSNTSMGTLSIANMKNFPINFHANDPYWPLINIVMQNAKYKRKYMAHMRTMLNEMFANNAYINFSNQIQSVIDTAVQSDTNKFFSYTQFQNSMTTDISLGNYIVPGITNLMSARISYLQALPEFTATTPEISNITSAYSYPTTTAYFTVQVSNCNTNGVYLGFRSNEYKKFKMFAMYDDGNHNDGAAGDNIYGIAVQADSANSQFYIYAENSNAAIFAPERAEHEYYYLSDYTNTSSLESVQNSFNIIPNPAHHLLNISYNVTSKQFVQIMDITGKVLLNEEKSFPAVFDVSAFKSGIYLIRIGALTKKLLIY